MTSIEIDEAAAVPDGCQKIIAEDPRTGRATYCNKPVRRGSYCVAARTASRIILKSLSENRLKVQRGQLRGTSNNDD